MGEGIVDPFIQMPLRDRAGNPVIGPDGKPVTGIVPNEEKRAVRDFTVITNPLTITLAAGSAAAPGAPEEVQFVIDTQGHFEWISFIGVSTGNFLINFHDLSATQRKLQNKGIHSSNIMGIARRPFRLPEPYLVNVRDGKRVITAILQDISQSPNTVRLALRGRRYYTRETVPNVAAYNDAKFKGLERTYSYFLMPTEFRVDGFNPDPIPGGGTALFTFRTDDDAETDIQKAMVVSTGPFEFTLREKSTNRTLSNGFVIDQAGWGNAQFAFHFVDSYLLERTKDLVMEVTDLSGSDNTIYPCLCGRRLQYAK